MVISKDTMTSKEKTTTSYEYNDDRDIIKQTVVREVEIPEPRFTLCADTDFDDLDDLEDEDENDEECHFVLPAFLAGAVIGLCLCKLFKK